MNINLKELTKDQQKALTKSIFTDLRTRKSDFWIKAGRQASLNLFKEAVSKVPAYKDFIVKKKRINPSKIHSWGDFVKYAPQVSKKTYLRKYKLEELCWDGSFDDKSLTFTATSGSTGKPFYFPRDERLDWQSSIMHEMFLRNDIENLNRSTLVIVGFGMGVWIGGLITYQAFRKISLGNYHISVITPGTNKKEIYEAIRELKDKYDQIVLTGYPPFIKDVIDEGKLCGVDWKKLNLKIVFAAESFSEEFRDHVVKQTGIKNLYTDTMNIYGSADLGTMAEETPVSILVRRMANKNPLLFKSLFREAQRLPTLVQFNPMFINFEEKDGEILCTAPNVLPLVRYAIGDQGGVLSFSEVEQILSDNNINLRKEAKKLGLEKTIAELPFVYIYERSDLSTKLYGAIIYPEHIKSALIKEEFSNYFTGRFTMLTKTDKDHNEYLEINVELRPHIKIDSLLANSASETVLSYLMEKNTEFKNSYHSVGEKLIPKLIFWEYQDPKYFKSGIKQKWVLN